MLRVMSVMSPSRRRLALAAVTGAGASMAAIALMGTSGWLISRAAQRPPVLSLLVAVVVVRALGIGRGVLRYLERLASHDVALRGVVHLRETVYRALADADSARVAALRRGDLLARVGADLDTLGDVVVRGVLPFAIAAVSAVLAVLALVLILPVTGLVLAVGLLLAGALAPALVAVAARRAERDAAAARAAMTTEAVGLLDALDELTVVAAVPGRLAHLRALDTELGRQLDIAARPSSAAAVVAGLAGGAATLGCLALGVEAVSAGSLGAVWLAVVTLVPLAAAEVTTPLPAAAGTLVRAGAAARRVLALLDLDGSARPVRPAAGPVRPAARPCGSAPPLGRVDLHADALSCGWPGRPPVVRGLDLDLTSGTRVAVVGPSGSGKTTLLLTLAGLLQPAAGQVTVAETSGGVPVPLADVPPDTLRGTVLFTADDAHVFATSVRENVCLGRPASDDAVIEALGRAGLASWLQGLPRGLDTLLGSADLAGSVPPSGGERRRLLLARALLHDVAVLLLDEPAEHLDPVAADRLVLQVLRSDRTVVVVTHRLSPLAAADQVLVLADGGLAARGTHDWLLRHHPPYAAAWQAEQDAVPPAASAR